MLRQTEYLNEVVRSRVRIPVRRMAIFTQVIYGSSQFLQANIRTFP
jgi:hypothetical protein